MGMDSITVDVLVQKTLGLHLSIDLCGNKNRNCIDIFNTQDKSMLKAMMNLSLLIELLYR